METIEEVFNIGIALSGFFECFNQLGDKYLKIEKNTATKQDDILKYLKTIKKRVDKHNIGDIMKLDICLRFIKQINVLKISYYDIEYLKEKAPLMG